MVFNNQFSIHVINFAKNQVVVFSIEHIYGSKKIFEIREIRNPELIDWIPLISLYNHLSEHIWNTMTVIAS